MAELPKANLSGNVVRAAGLTMVLIAGALVSCSTTEESTAPVGPIVNSQDLSTISCPDVAGDLKGSSVDVPAVQERLGLLDQQWADAYQSLANAGADPKAVGATLENLAKQRRQTIAEISDSLHVAPGERSAMLDMAACSVKEEPGGFVSGEEITTLKGRNGKDGQREGNGLTRRDFIDITKVPSNAPARDSGKRGATGTFRSKCGNNANQRHLNADNVVVSPGEKAAAHHEHDYVGNTSTDFRSTVKSLSQSGTTCANKDDLSTYYAPVVRQLDSPPDRDANRPGGGRDLNSGSIVTPDGFDITFEGNPAGTVAPMEFGTKIITGDAKAFTNGPKNARALWSCTGFEQVQLKDKYPLCPLGSKVVRSLNFPNCSNGQTDSANHRTHTAFADGRGKCPSGFRAIPQLVMKITYSIPVGKFYAVDTFPEQLHKAVTDHADFIDVMSKSLMDQVVRCINSGQNC
ncbi:DUF1996 domain-containing protein [Kitasatospora sp. NPDC089509]|uniref:DUF1996 domain-containing protein n=1 Tax=Kitasatospora sp. NPDC089509 TaxID=3364079 RepID=UPI00380064D1